MKRLVNMVWFWAPLIAASLVPARGSAADKPDPKALFEARCSMCHPLSTFFEGGAVAHVELANPFCPGLRKVLAVASAGFPARVHQGGTYVCMEGPQFSTRAESELHRSWGASLIGMTVMPEAKLAREAEICYALVALPTDYDCWRPHPAHVDQLQLIEEILGNVKAATQNALELVRRAIPAVAAQADKPCACQSALRLALWTDRSRIPAETRRRLWPLLGKYHVESGGQPGGRLP